MRFTAYILTAGLAVLATVRPAEAFGRGGYARGGAVAGPQGAAWGGARGGAVAGPYGAAAGNVHHGTYVGPGGSTVQHVGGHGVEAGLFGGVHAGGGGATRVTSPTGQTYTTGHRGGATVGPAGGVAVHGAAGAATAGPYGAAAVGHRGGVAVGQAGGVYAGGARAGVGVGAYGGGVAVGHATRYVGPTAMWNTANVVRTGYRYPFYTSTWHTAHPAAWTTARWVSPSLWAVPAWPAVATYVGVTTPPVVYDYGSNVVIQDDTMYMGGEPAGSAADYAAQAATFADAGRAAKPADTDDWQPLGVFGLIQGDEQVAQRIFQLAVNKAGVVRGNYYDAVADNTLPVFGSVDPKSQRVAWSIGEKKDIIFEAGLNNLTQQQTTALVHYGKESTQQMVLVRLEEPKDGK
jgi:hypothetical protein